MELCKKIEDLTCVNCIYSSPDEEDNEGTYCHYHYTEPEDSSDRWVTNNFFCHDGEWAAKVKVEETTYVDGRKVSSTMEECVKVAGRAQMISCFLNDNVFDWL